MRQNTPIEKQQAIKLAVEAVRDSGRDPSRYNIKAEEMGKEWFISFEGKPPRPPGDELFVYVSKDSGKIRLMLGE